MFITWPLNPYVAADSHGYFRFKCPVLHLSGEYFPFHSKVLH
jgi:hypothetical protein